jgi:hypothetical protein
MAWENAVHSEYQDDVAACLAEQGGEMRRTFLREPNQGPQHCSHAGVVRRLKVKI